MGTDMVIKENPLLISVRSGAQSLYARYDGYRLNLV